MPNKAVLFIVTVIVTVVIVVVIVFITHLHAGIARQTVFLRCRLAVNQSLFVSVHHGSRLMGFGGGSMTGSCLAFRFQRSGG